jgi:uncharacterized protein (TIGR03435 family)
MKRTLTTMMWLAASMGLQAQTAKLPASFDVVSVRVNNSGSHSIGIDVEKNSFTATNVTLLDLIAEAYGIKSDLVSNAPGWMSSLRFDVQAKVLDADDLDLQRFSDKERGPILQAMLAEKFQLKMHPETKTLAVYELVPAKGGVKVKQSAPVEGAAPMPLDGNYTVHNGEIDGHGMTMVSVAATLTDVVRRKVIDKTGLTGGYDVDLKWTPEEALNGGKDSGGSDAAPPIFTAVQEQLGLKLQAGKGPVETLVVDHVEKPAEN